MVTALYVVFGTFVATALYVLIVEIAEDYSRTRQPHLVTCPETQRTAAVHIDAGRASLRHVFGARPEYRLHACSRWPEKRGCDQACTKQIAAAPDDTTVPAVVGKWYVERSCVGCAKAVGFTDLRRDHPLLFAEGEPLTDWEEVAPELLPDMLATHMPICRDCRIAGSLHPRGANA